MSARTKLLKPAYPEFNISTPRLERYRHWRACISATPRHERLLRFEKRLEELFARQAY